MLRRYATLRSPTRQQSRGRCLCFLSAAQSAVHVYGRTDIMRHTSRGLVPAAIIAFAVSGATAVHAQSNNPPNAYQVNPLVSDLPGAPVTDPNLKNPWGVTFSPAASTFWISDNPAGVATLYDGDGTIVPFVVTIPCPATAGQGSSCPSTTAPTGTVCNPTAAFLLPGT